MGNEETKRAFHAWEDSACKKVIVFGQWRIVEGGYSSWGAGAEMVWDQVGSSLQVWCDNWKVFSYIQDVLDKLSKLDKGENLSPEQFQQLLVSCGFEALESKRNAE